MKRTKIIGTIGPSSMDYNVMKNLVLAGLNVVRINLSHAKIKDMNLIIQNVKKLRKELNLPLPVMIDTRGPEVRVGTFINGFAEIKKGQNFIFDSKTSNGDNSRVSISVPKIISNIKVGDKILANDGLITFEVIKVEDNQVITKAKNYGTISNRKSLFIPGVEMPKPYLNKEDKKDILWGIENDVDFVAASFVNSASDVKSLKSFISKNGGDMKIVSKIESQQGIKNIDEIIDASDAIMVARGDLGVEVAMEVLPELQKLIIKKSVQKGKPVITATEMLESMINNNRPTRAEVSDVANAVYDGTSCVMLSGETASGKFPVEAVRTMAKVCLVTEKSITKYNRDLNRISNTSEDFISQGVVSASNSSDIKLIVTYTNVGTTANLISRYRPKTPILAITPNEKTYRQMDMIWGVTPIKSSTYETTDEMFSIANNIIKKGKYAKKGDKVIVTNGTPNLNGGTNLLKIIEID